MISFAVVGHPETQGSKRAFARNGRAWVVEAGGKRHADWRSAVADAARQANPGELWTGPVSVRLHFALTRPASAPKRRRTWPIGARSGDVDKLARAVLDAITSTVLRDDSQVVRLEVTKDWGDPPGVKVSISDASTLDDVVHSLCALADVVTVVRPSLFDPRDERPVATVDTGGAL